jgi:hypothetical protein
MIRSFFLILLVIHGIQLGYSQESNQPVDPQARLAELAFWGDVMYNASVGEHRERAGRFFHENIVAYVADHYELGLDEFPWIQLQAPADTSFLLITWQHKNADNWHQPYGLIAKRDGAVTVFDQTEPDWADLRYSESGVDAWPPAVYYNMRPMGVPKDSTFLLMGYHGWDDRDRVRLLDVLRFRDGEVIFGAPVFVMDKDTIRPDAWYRMTLRYSANANVRIQVDDSLGLIMMDHLIPIKTPDGHSTLVPDGSYEAFEWRDNAWHFIDKVFHQTQDSPPGLPRTVEAEERDLFGRKQ